MRSRLKTSAPSLLASFVALGVALGGIETASAHAVLAQKEAPIGSSYKAVIQIGHGCEGSATVKIRVRVPEGLIAAKPQPKPGWNLEIISGKYDKAYPYYHGATLSEGVKEIVWSGGPLPDAWYDEFTFVGLLSGDLTPGTTLWFPVVQECEKGVNRWIEIPEAGKTSHDYEHPAPGLKLLPKQQ